MEDLILRLHKLMEGRSLPGKSGLLQDIKIFAQYVPQPSGITFADRDNKGLKHYEAGDYESNFPCIIVRLEDMTDLEERSRTHSICNVKLLIGIYDDKPECQGYVDVLDIQEAIRSYLLEHRILCSKHLLVMPVKCRLLDNDTWPVYFGEISLAYQVGRPVRAPEFVYAYDGAHTREEL